MEFLWFLLGLSIGLVLWGWQRSRSNIKLRVLLRNLKPDVLEAPFSSTSQLSLAIAYQQRIRQHLEQEVETYKQVLHLAPIGYLQVDDENRLTWCNTQAKELLGIVQNIAPEPRLLLEVVRSYELDHLIEQTRNLGQPCQNDWTFYPATSDPSRLSLQQTFALRGYGFPLPRDYVGIFLENRQEALILMQQRDRWASDVAHELKTPLTSIRLVAETLQSRLDPSLRSWVDRLVNETVRLGNLVQDLLDLGQLDRAAFQSLKLKQTDLAELIQAAWLNLEPLARRKKLMLEYSGPEGLVIQVDEPRIYRVLINLLDNSIKYSPTGESIKVKLAVNTSVHSSQEDQQAEPYVCLEVVDAGPGFPEEALPHVFERFYRADPSRARRTVEESPGLTALGAIASQGTQPKVPRDQPTDFSPRNSSGLGLAIVKQIVEVHQGRVDASNHPETGGAWLRVWLPYGQREEAKQD